MFVFIIINLIALIATSPVSQFNDITDFIFGGQNAKEGQFPHQVSILYADIEEHHCGGSIINKSWVLTAAHCVAWINISKIKISAGHLEYNKGTKYDIEKAFIHEGYLRSSYDIALLKIAGDGFDLSNPHKIAIIELLKEEVPVGSHITISGWGFNNNCIIEKKLQFNDDLKAGESIECRSRFFTETSIESILCLRHEAGNGGCFGDSGGPAHYKGKLAGLLNYGTRGCGTDNPDVFAKVNFFKSWIEKTMNDYVNG